MSNIELFLDRHRISWEHNIDRQLNQPFKFEGNPILEGEHSWEASFVAVYGNVLPREGGGFRIWYHAGAKGHQSDKVLCYAESDDGFNWKRMMVSNEPYDGVSPTNIVLGPKPTVAVPCVIKNHHSNDSNEKFLLMFNSYVRDYPELAVVMQGAKRWCFVATSPNGIAWSPPKGRLAIPGKADCPISIVWDEVNRRYIAYLRGNRKPQPFDPNHWGRTLNRRTSATCVPQYRGTSSIGQTQLRSCDAMKATMIHLDRFSRWPSPGVAISSLDCSAL